MPQVFRIGSYIIYFWSNENDPLEPVHVHIAEGRASANATKIWITSSGKALLCDNNSRMKKGYNSDSYSLFSCGNYRNESAQSRIDLLTAPPIPKYDIIF